MDINENHNLLETSPYVPAFMEGVPGVEAITNPVLAKEIQKKAAQIIGWKGYDL